MFISCTKKDINIERISFSPDSIEVQILSTSELVVNYTPNDAINNIEWISSSSTVAEVTEGIITALKLGTATITASSGSVSSSCYVSVIDTNLYVKSINIIEDSISLRINAGMILVSELIPATAIGDVSWTSADSSIATVNQQGFVSAIKAGKTHIIASSEGCVDSCKITVPFLPTEIHLNTNSLNLPQWATDTLKVSLLPTGTTAPISWMSTNPGIVTVKDGVITALKSGVVTIIASTGYISTLCEVTVIDNTLSGSNYYVIQMSDATYESIKERVIQDLRPDDETKFLFVWDGTFSNNTSSGLDFYGQDLDWISLIVGNTGWSGAGYYTSSDYGEVDMTDLYNHPDDYVFHIGLKSAQASSSFLFIFSDGATEVKLCVGPQEFVDNGTSYLPYADFTRDNEWHSIEIPIRDLNEKGLFFNNTYKERSFLSFLAGGTTGTTLDMDAIFYYKKGEK